jgi:hypothetical protein
VEFKNFYILRSQPQLFDQRYILALNLADQMSKVWYYISSSYDPNQRDYYYNQFRFLENQFFGIVF